jgi:S1-C subfamily serine protease
VFKRYAGSVVKVYKLDDVGRRMDASSGFVLLDGVVATAFQAIDSAASLEIEFADGRKATTSEVLQASRLGDWAAVRVDTGKVPPIPRMAGEGIAVGSVLAALVLESDARAAVPVDVRAVSTQGIYGRRVHIGQTIQLPSVGGPLINEQGEVVAIAGGSLKPGNRIDQRSANMNRWLSRSQEGAGAGTPIDAVPQAMPSRGRTLAELAAAGVLTTPLTGMPEFVFGGSVAQLSKDLSEIGIGEQSEYSMRGDPQVAVYSNWIKRGKISRGDVTVVVYDADNKARLTTPPKRLNLRDQEQRLSISIAPKQLGVGYYRVDVCWDGKPAWRTYIRIVE